MIRPESVAPETWARVGVAEKRAKARASDRQIHFAKEELQPLLNIFIPLARFPCESSRPCRGERLRAEALRNEWTGRMVLGECEGNHNRVQYTMHPIENLSTSSAS